MKTMWLVGWAAMAAVCMGQGAPAPAAAELKRVQEAEFGAMADGSAVKIYTLTNSKGMSARIVTYGGTIAGIKAPDKTGALTNVVATADTWQQSQRYNLQAQTIGRVANRIAGAKFTLDGKEYATQANNGAHTLHSGAANFGTRNWGGKVLDAAANEGAVQLTLVSKDGDGGFPGTLTLKVTYSLNDSNEFTLAYEATADKATPVNVTNHAYFNLAGAPGWGNAGGAAAPASTDQELWIDADKYLIADATLIPTGAIAPVKETPLDFTRAAIIGSRMAALAPMRSYDHAFVLNSGGGKMATVARLRDPKSGREMEVRTDQPGLQIYSGQRAGIAVETQHHPDSVHHDNFPSIVLKPGDVMRSRTTYAFSAK
jgi:aldose 1-epimerase